MAETPEMPHVWSVAELTRAVRGSLEGAFPSVDLEGEVSGYKLYPSGHAYFTLKDDSAQICAVFFKSCRAACPFAEQIRNGVKLKVRGAVSVDANSRFEILVRRAKPVGEGELMARFLALKAKLEAEGLFDERRKRPIPFLPRRIGLVTSPSGAVVHDLCRVLMRRFPNVEIRLFPSAVQGAAAPASLIAGLAHFNDPANPWRADVVIFGRGGGSFEDLFCFNDEALVRAVAASTVPTISAVGHQNDFTLCDFAADVRAGTPSMAAELAVPVKSELVQRVKTAADGLVAALRGQYEWEVQRLDKLAEALSPALRMKAQDFSRRLDSLSSALASTLELARVKAEGRLAEATRALELLSPYGVLERGYSLTTDAAGNIVRAADGLSEGSVIRTRFARGSVTSTVNAEPSGTRE